MEYYGKILCISYHDLTSGENPVMSVPNYKKLSANGKINVVRQGKGLGNYALVEVATLPMRFQEKIKEKYGRIDILVNNAGGYPKEIYKNIEHQAIKIWEWSEEQWDQIIKTNLRIPFLVTKNVVPVMIKQGKGDIVNVSSRMGRIASQMGAYAVAKGGIVTMTKTTAIQTKEYGIKCNAVSPGIVDTPGQRVYNHSVGQDGCPMGSSKDVAKAIIYLLADSPTVMTGQSIDLFTTV